VHHDREAAEPEWRKPDAAGPVDGRVIDLWASLVEVDLQDIGIMPYALSWARASLRTLVRTGGAYG
jgi:hypothetical protein